MREGGREREQKGITDRKKRNERRHLIHLCEVSQCIGHRSEKLWICKDVNE